MKKFAKYTLIFIMITILSGVIGYIVVNARTSSVYESTTQLYVVPGLESENSLRTHTGSLNEDFAIVFKSNMVISDAQRLLGTTEDLASYITVKAPAKSNIIEITCVNPDQATAKKYVDAIAKSALKATSILPVEKISILSEGTQSNIAVKPDLYRNTLYIVLISMQVTFLIELIVGLLTSVFAKVEDDDEAEYNKYYGNNAGFSYGKPYTRDEAIKSMDLAAATIERNETEELKKNEFDFEDNENDEDDELEAVIFDDELTVTLSKEAEQVKEAQRDKSSSDILVRIPR